MKMETGKIRSRGSYFGPMKQRTFSARLVLFLGAEADDDFFQRLVGDALARH